MVTKEINSVEKIRVIITSNTDISSLEFCSTKARTLLSHYKKVLNTQRAKECEQLIHRINRIKIQKMV